MFGTITSPKTAGVSFTISITAKDAFGNVATSYTGTNALSDTIGTIIPTMTGAFVNGIWSGDVVINKIANNVKISTSGGGKTGESNAFNVVAGPPAPNNPSPIPNRLNKLLPYKPRNVRLSILHKTAGRLSKPFTNPSLNSSVKPPQLPIKLLSHHQPPQTSLIQSVVPVSTWFQTQKHADRSDEQCSAFRELYSAP
ncbi:MAG: hypothetical protein ACUVTL_01240 [Thermoproteota archaeon]